MNLPKKQGQRLIPEYLLKYNEELHKNHPDPSAEWGGSGSEYTAGEGIDITNNTISIDDTVALKEDIITSYNDLTDKPTIPTKTSDLTNDSGFITGITSTDVTNALGYTPGTSNFSGDYDDLTDKPDLSIYAESANLATVATTGDYEDLTNKPTIPQIPVVTITTGQQIGSGSITADEYNALLNNPNAILIFKGYYGSNTEVYLKQSFNTAISTYLYYESNVSYGQSSISNVGVSIKSDYTWIFDGGNLSIPTNTSDLNNDSGYITANDIPTYTTLFSRTPDAGTTAYTITLSDDITKYDEIKIYYNQNDDVIYKNCIIFPKLSVGDKLNITAFGNGTNRLYTKNDCFEVATTTSLVLVNSIQQRVGNNEATQISASTNQYRVRPYKIIGIKY